MLATTQCGSLRLGISTATTRPALTRASARATSPCSPPSGLRPASLVTWPSLRGRLPEAPVPHELVHEAWIGRVAAARVGHHEDTGTRNPLRLRPGPAARGATEELSVCGDPHERHDRRPNRRNGSGQPLPTPRVVRGGELRRFARGSRRDVGESEPILRKAHVVDKGQRLTYEAGGVQQPVERIAWPREVMADSGRGQARVDPDEEDAGLRAETRR